jgi:hypothetical protein
MKIGAGSGYYKHFIGRPARPFLRRATGLLQLLPLVQEYRRCFFQSVLQNGSQELTRKVWDCLTKQRGQLL